MATWDDVQRLAMAMPQSDERISRENRQWRVKDKLFVWERPLRRAGMALLIAVAGFGLCMIGFALSRSFVLSLGLLAASGAFDMVSILVRSTLLQLRVPHEMMGRVAAINQVFVGSSNEVGAFESGLAARLFGVTTSVLAGGVVTLGVVAFSALRSRELRALGSLASEAAVAEKAP